MVYAKYKNKKVEVDGFKFDSKKEARRYSELKLLEMSGEIYGLELQKKFVLIPSQKDANGKTIERECSYYADFVYYQKGTMIVEDTKGFKTPEYIIKRKLMLNKYGVRITEI